MPIAVANRPAGTRYQPLAERVPVIRESRCPVLLLPNRLPKGLTGEAHTHDAGQLIHPRRGRFRVWAGGRVWVMAPWRAIWIPPRVEHRVEVIDETIVDNVYVRTEEIAGLPRECALVNVTPLLRELLAHGATLADDARASEADSRIRLAITDQIRSADTFTNLGVPMSDDRRLRPILDGLVARPDDNRGLDEWAAATGAGVRTLSRLFVRETGLSFRQWKQRLRVAEAVARLGEGRSVLTIALDLGYAGQSAFTVMFRETMGVVPSSLARPGGAGRNGDRHAATLSRNGPHLF